MTLPIRHRTAGRSRPRRVVRASSFPLSRLLAAVALLASSAALYGVTAAPTFSVDVAGIEVRGARHTDPAAVLRALELPADRGPNVFRIETPRMADALRSLPAVLDAEVGITLPDRLVIELRERQAVLAWQIGSRRFLVDVEGNLFRELPPSADAGVPVVVDRRRGQAPRVGMQLAAVELAAVRKLAALTPRLIGSAAPRLRVAVDDQHGFTLQPDPGGWRAILGFYTPNIRPATLVDEQVRCLHALLRQGESQLRAAFLFPDADRCGTFRSASASPEASRSPPAETETSP